MIAHRLGGELSFFIIGVRLFFDMYKQFLLLNFT